MIIEAIFRKEENHGKLRPVYAVTGKTGCTRTRRCRTRTRPVPAGTGRPAHLY